MTAPEPASVLIVDDNAEKRVALEAILHELPVDIVRASSGKEALRWLLQRDFAVILLDVRMPGMDGFETASLIRRRVRSEQTPIIFITAFPDETHAARGYSLRAVDYILTPVVPDVLRTKVSVLVDLFRTTAEVRRQAESLRQRAAQLHRLTAASLAINAAGSLDRMLEVVTTSALEILGADRAVAVATLDDRRTHRAVAPPSPGLEHAESERALASTVCRTNRPSRTPEGELAAPLVGSGGQNIGLVQIARRHDPEFVQEEEDILLQLAQMASIAIENTLFCEAREANRLKDEFLATVSHELRTPLNAMVSWAWMLRSGTLGTDATARAAEAIERSVKSQARIIDDLLDVSRIVTGKLRLSSRLIDLAPVVDLAVESVMPAAEAKAIQLVRAVDARGALVLGDPGRLQQVVWNLLSNAIKFTARGGRIEVQLRRTADDVELRVSDSGQGIPVNFLPHVFERFRQADASSTRRTGGLGLGLSIVHHLVELHGGRVEAHSDGEGRGATFVVTLPLGAPLEVALAPNGQGPSEGDAARPPRLDGLAVLLVEDEPDTRDGVCLLLSRAGARVIGVGSGDEALLAIQAMRPDVLVCDIGLPGEDGYALLRRIRAGNGHGQPFIPAVALTAYAQEQDRQRAEGAGFHSHIAKPVEPAELLRVLASAVGSAPRLERPKLVAGGEEL
jgi:signal transduction histidine kinase